jgi:hypothetical protein
MDCLASPRALDGLPEALRIAPDEALVILPPGDTAPEIGAQLARSDPDAVVLDVSDGWAAWSLEGEGATDALAHVSELELPTEGFVQGDVARVPVKVIARDGVLHLLVPSMWGAYLRDRILVRCPGVTERREPQEWTR